MGLKGPGGMGQVRRPEALGDQPAAWCKQPNSREIVAERLALS